MSVLNPPRPAPAADGQVTRPRRLSGFQPTGALHLGNYLGAIRPMIDSAGPAGPTADRRPAADAGPTADTESVVMIADLHALTVEHDPARLRRLTTDVLATLLAAGVDPLRTLIYVQSDVPDHAELHYLLECATGYGEAARMIQFREKSAGQHQVRLSLLTYPVLMAADILLHDADEVPVGEDQTQHLELARDVANRFNTRYGRTFVVPRAVSPAVAARVMDLGNPAVKMGKSSASGTGVIHLLDPPDTVRRTVTRAVTDPGTEVSYDRYRKPGVANLLEILAALTHGEPAEIAEGFGSYGALKETVADAVIEALRPLRDRHAALVADPAHLDQIRRDGAARARQRAGDTVRRAKRAIGLT